ncbi:MAG: (deoxy)nucleoside triphosphate pyrophosphohydrolase [bacterium]|nr:(deoxy)nucleoside triphosphate pyrophosphohydrolase [bacterium]
MNDGSTDRISLALVCRNRLWLVERRQSVDSLAGLWEFPGGKIRAGETAAQAAVRECAEETGLYVEPVDELEPIEHTYNFVRVMLHPVLCRLVQGPPISRDSARGNVRWVTTQELARLEMPAANRSLVEALVKLRVQEDDLPPA